MADGSKKHDSEPHEEHADETWLIPYSDLLTLLLALFIVLFASSTLDKKKMGMMENAFAAAFNYLPADQLNGTIGEFLDEAAGLDLGEGITLGSDSQGVVIEISSLSLFDSGSSVLKPALAPAIWKISDLLRQNRYKRFRVVVEGHTDDAEAADSGFRPSGNCPLTGRPPSFANLFLPASTPKECRSSEWLTLPQSIPTITSTANPFLPIGKKTAGL